MTIHYFWKDGACHLRAQTIPRVGEDVHINTTFQHKRINFIGKVVSVMYTHTMHGQDIHVELK